MRVVKERAYVIYRASGRSKLPVEVHRVATPASATVADAWMRLTRIDSSVDPRSLEIEVRLLPRRTVAVAPPDPARRPAPPIGRRLAGAAAMAHHVDP